MFAGPSRKRVDADTGMVRWRGGSSYKRQSQAGWPVCGVGSKRATRRGDLSNSLPRFWMVDRTGKVTERRDVERSELDCYVDKVEHGLESGGEYCCKTCPAVRLAGVAICLKVDLGDVCSSQWQCQALLGSDVRGATKSS